MPPFYPTRVDYSGPLISQGADDVVLPHERESIDRSAAGIILDDNLRFLARADTLVCRAIGKALARLQQGDSLMELGYSSLRDYVHQRVGISERLGYELARVEREIRKYPRMDAAFQDGRLSRSHVRLLLLHVSPDEDAEWVERAAGLTVRRLHDALEERAKAQPDSESEFEPSDAEVLGGDPLAPPAGRMVEFTATRLQAAKWDVALEMARRDAGADIPESAVVESMAAEFLNAEGNDALNRAAGKWLPPPPDEGARAAAHRERTEKSRRMQRTVEDAYNHWSYLDWRIPLVDLAPDLDVPEDADPWAVDLVVRKAVLLGQRVKGFLMRLLYTVSSTGLRVDMGFLSLGHYAVERLGLSARTVGGLVALQRAFFHYPVVARAFYAGELTQTQAEKIVMVVQERTQAAWVRHARGITTKQLGIDVKRALKQGWGAMPPPPEPPPEERPSAAPEGDPQLCAEPGAAAQTCAVPGWPPLRVSFHQQVAEAIASARGQKSDGRASIHIKFWLPAELETLWERALTACCALRGQAVPIADCVEMMADAFLVEWGQQAIQAVKKHRLLDRDGWACSSPVCRRRKNLHEHHVTFRSRGGDNSAGNLTSTCESDHHRGIHTGRTKVTGTAPDGLRWELGCRSEGAPHMVVENGRIVSVMEPDVRLSAVDVPATYHDPQDERDVACA